MPSVMDCATLSFHVYGNVSNNALRIARDEPTPFQFPTKLQPTDLSRYLKPNGPAIRALRPRIPLQVEDKGPQQCNTKQGTKTVTWFDEHTADFPRFGFYAKRYRNERGEIVISYCGTQGFFDKDFMINDIPIMLQQTPPQALYAALLASYTSIQNPNSNIYLTGHSLGGALAILAAAKLGLPAVTFNAPGVQTSCFQLASISNPSLQALVKHVGNCLASPRIQNHGVDYDIVYNFGSQVSGRQSGVKSTCSSLQAICRHSIENLKKLLACDSKNYLGLNL